MKTRLVLAAVIALSAFYTSNVFADCYDQCMSIKGCWHKGQTYSSYCGSAEVNCEAECWRKEEQVKAFGAIAYSQNDGSYGFSHGQENRKEAERVALGYCGQYGKNCKAMVWFYNSCGAVAANDRGKTGWGRADTEEAAQKKAMKSCGKKNCEIKVSHCSFEP